MDKIFFSPRRGGAQSLATTQQRNEKKDLGF
jgi:hypothetical protein